MPTVEMTVTGKVQTIASNSKPTSFRSPAHRNRYTFEGGIENTRRFEEHYLDVFYNTYTAERGAFAFVLRLSLLALILCSEKLEGVTRNSPFLVFNFFDVGYMPKILRFRTAVPTVTVLYAR